MHTKSLSFYVALVALGLPLCASGQTLAVTPKTLDGWTVSGADKSAIARESSLMLPAGAQLSRQFPGSAVILHVVTQPEFSTETAEWPIAGVGSLALALVRKGTEGQLILVVDETNAIDLPWSIPLGEKRASIELIVAYDPASGTGLVSLQGKAKLFDVSPSAKPTDVWLSAGEKFDWPFDQLQVELLSLDADQSSQAGAADKTSGKKTRGEQLKAAADRLLAQGGSSATSEAAAAGTSSPPIANAASTLEVFTPPSIRLAKVIAAVRSTVAKSQRK